MRAFRLSYSQGHNDIFVCVIRVAGDVHLRLGVAVFELEGDALAA
jgi:hypothetical protein